MHSLLRISAAVLLAAPAVAAAVSLDPQGRGQALIFPYYTVRSVEGDAFNTFVSIVNTAADAKALRVRFREGRNGREVARFNLFLNGGDMWTGAVVPFAEGARLVTADTSCASPGFADFAVSPLPFMDFNSASYTGANADGAGEGLDRTREGFVEAIEMGTVPMPINCESVRNAATLAAGAPTGGLTGTLTLINVASGMDFTVNAEALADLASRPYYRPISDPYPDYDAAEVDRWSSGTVEGKAYRAVWDRGVDAVSSVLMTSILTNEYVLGGATLSRTDWVLTSPTRRFYASGTGLSSPFSPASDLRCGSQTTVATMFNREARGPLAGPVFETPGPQPPPPTCLRWSATVFTIANGSSHTALGPFASANPSLLPLAVTSTNQAGWGSFAFPENGKAGMLVSRPESVLLDAASGAVTTGPLKFSGIPVLGFMARTFKNGNLDCGASTCQGNYGGAFPHRPVRRVGAP